MQFRSTVIALVAGAVSVTAPASAATLPGYTPSDQKMFDKLEALVGTWNCPHTPESRTPVVITIKHQGAYYVQRETGKKSLTAYYRWSRTLQRYEIDSLTDEGGFFILQSLSKDPGDATWAYVYPANLSAFPYHVAVSGSTLTITGLYTDDKGKPRHPEAVCTKQ